MRAKLILLALMMSVSTYAQNINWQPMSNVEFQRGIFKKFLLLPFGDTTTRLGFNNRDSIGAIMFHSDKRIYIKDIFGWRTLSSIVDDNSFIKNDTTNYQNSGFSVNYPSRISYLTDTTNDRLGALEVYRTVKDAPIPNRVVSNIRSVLRVSNTTSAASDSREMASIYGGLHINSDNIRAYVNGTEGIIAVAGTASNFGNGDIEWMSDFGANSGSSPTATGIVKKFAFYKVTGHSLNGGTSKTARQSGFAQPKLTAGFTANINWLSGLGADTLGPEQLGLVTWPTGNWNMYDASGYKSFHSGNLMIGDTAENNFALRVAGKIKGTDTAHLSKIVGGTLSTDKITLRNYSGSLSPISADSNGLSIGTVSGINGTLLNISKTYTNPQTGVTGIRSTPQVYETASTHNWGLIGAVIQPIVNGNNTRDWTIPIQGISIAPTISSGATGTINSIVGETVTNQLLSTYAVVDTFVYRRTYKAGQTVTPVNNEIFDLVGYASGIGGHWSRYDATAYNSYWGTGNQLINTATDNGFGDKLQVSGRISASRATRGSNVTTLDQLDSLSEATITREATYDTSFAHYKWVIEKNTRSIFSKIITAYKGNSALINMFNIGDSYTAMLGKYFLFPLSHLLVNGGQVNNISPYASGIGAPLSGRDLQYYATSTNFSYNYNDNAHWPSGVTYTINDGGVINWNSGGASPTFTTLKLFYFKEPGGGMMNVVIAGNTVATLDCSSLSDTSLQVYTYKQIAGQSAVSTNVSGGKTTIVEAHIIDTTKNGVDLYTCGRFGIRMDSMFMYKTALNALTTYLKEANIDIMTFEAKEQILYADGTTYGYRLNQLANVLDSTMHNGCKVWVGSSPVKLASEDTSQLRQNDTLFRIAHERGYIYWDGYSPLKSYSEVASLKWGIADGVHLSDTAHAYRAGLLWRELGLDDVVMGMGVKAINDRQHPSNLGVNTTIGVNTQQQLKFNTDNAGLDWKIMYRRLLSLTDTSGNVIASFSPQTGNNILMANYGIGAQNKRFILKSYTGLNLASFLDSTQANNNLPISSGFIMPGSYTTTQINNISANAFAGALAYVSDAATTRGKIMWAMGVPWNAGAAKWVPINHVYQAGSASYVPSVGIYDTTTNNNVTGAALQLTEGLLPGLSFWVSSAVNTYAERMRLLSTGKLLIGSTADDGSGNTLQVNGGITSAQIKLTGGAPNIGKVLTDTTGTGVGAWRRQISTIKSYYTDSSSAANVMRYNIPSTYLSLSGDRVKFMYAGTFSSASTTHTVGINVNGTSIGSMSNGTTIGGNWKIEGTLVRVDNSNVKVDLSIIFDNSSSAGTNLTFHNITTIDSLDLNANGLDISVNIASPTSNVTVSMGDLISYPQ